MFKKVFVIGIIFGTAVSNIVETHQSLENETKNQVSGEQRKGWSLVDSYNEKAVPFYESSHFISLVGDFFELYVDVNNVNARLVLTLRSENVERVLSYVYNGSREKSEIWDQLVFPIKHNGDGYIHLSGYSDDNEKVLIDSVYTRYKTHKNQESNDEPADILIIYEKTETNKAYIKQSEDTINNRITHFNVESNKNNGEEVERNNIENHDDTKYLYDVDRDVHNNVRDDEKDNVSDQEGYNEGGDEGNNKGDEKGNNREVERVNNIEGVGEDNDGVEQENNTIEDTSGENEIEEDANSERLLSTWIIILIVVGAVTVIAIVATIAYQIGYNSGLDKNSVEYLEDIEPARVVTIPRVKGVMDSPIGDLM